MTDTSRAASPTPTGARPDDEATRPGPDRRRASTGRMLPCAPLALSAALALFAGLSSTGDAVTRPDAGYGIDPVASLDVELHDRRRNRSDRGEEGTTPRYRHRGDAPCRTDLEDSAFKHAPDVGRSRAEPGSIADRAPRDTYRRAGFEDGCSRHIPLHWVENDLVAYPDQAA